MPHLIVFNNLGNIYFSTLIGLGIVIKVCINTLGVALATIGAFLVWYFIAELNFSDKDAFLQGEGMRTIPKPTPADIKLFKLKIFISRLGLLLIVIGGLLQIISNYLSENT